MHRLSAGMRQALQSDEDGQRIGSHELRNWGAMIRAEERYGPKGYPPCPMFKDYRPRYRDETPSRESFRADTAYLTMDLINLLINDEMELLAIFIFYAEPETHENTAFSTELFNSILENDGKASIGVSRFQKYIRMSEIRIGTAIIMHESDDSWQANVKLMKG